MAQDKDTREAASEASHEANSEAVTAAKAVTVAVAEAAAPTEAPSIVPEPFVAAAEPVAIEAPAVEPQAVKAPVVEAPHGDVKLPHAPQLQVPAAASPPPFLREHENRVIAARPAPRVRPAPPKAAAANRPKSRFPLLAATLALAAGLGGAIGAVGVPAAMQLAIAPPPAAAPANNTTTEIQALRTLTTQLAVELGALRNATEQSSKTAWIQFGKIADRLDKAERAQAEPGAKLTRITESLDRLEKRAAAPAHSDVTGSVAPPPPPEPKPKPVIIEDYIVRRVLDGVALVEGRRGIIEVEPGSTLPGAGRVEEIRRQDGRWVVVTTKGMIVPVR